MLRHASDASSYGLLLMALCITAISLVGCRQQVFNLNESLPAFPGITSKLEMKVGSEHANYTIGDAKKGELYVWQTTRNDSDHTIKVYLTPFLQVNRVVVRTKDGGAVATTELWEKYRYPRRHDVGQAWLAPGEERVDVYPIDQLFDLSKPGEYTVEVAKRYIVPGVSQEYYATNPEPLSFSVPIEREAARGVANTAPECLRRNRTKGPVGRVK